MYFLQTLLTELCVPIGLNNIVQMFVFRIQQIQLLGRDMRGSEHDQLWNQIEAEIHLHRHKTVIRACRGRKDPNNKTPAPPPPPQAEAVGEEEDAESKARKRRGIGEPRTVVIHKDKTEGLGISITVRICNSFILIQNTVPACCGVVGPGMGRRKHVPPVF